MTFPAAVPHHARSELAFSLWLTRVLPGCELRCAVAQMVIVAGEPLRETCFELRAPLALLDLRLPWEDAYLAIPLAAPWQATWSGGESATPSLRALPPPSARVYFERFNVLVATVSAQDHGPTGALLDGRFYSSESADVIVGATEYLTEQTLRLARASIVAQCAQLLQPIVSGATGASLGEALGHGASRPFATAFVRGLFDAVRRTAQPASPRSPLTPPRLR